MKWIPKTAVAVLAGVLAGQAMAARVIVGVGLGFPAPMYVAPPVYYYPPPVVAVVPAAPPPVYVEQAPVAAAPAAAAPANVWYYCGSPKGYYPYVKNCRVAWQPVPATPPEGAGAP